MPEELKSEFRTLITESVNESVDARMKATLEDVVGPEVATRVEKALENYRVDVALNGNALAAEKKLAFAKDLRTIASGEKAAYLSTSDQAGGYLVPTEVSTEIMRIAATVGLVARDARMFPMGSDELELPIYTGSVMQGAFLGQDTEGSETQTDIGVARLQAKFWYNIFRFSNILLNDANVAVADWILALVAEGLAYRMDREAFMGGTFAGSPFVGLLATASGATVQTLATGNTSFDKLTLPEASDMIGALDTSALNDAAFYMHRTVWAKLRARSTSGVFEYGQSNLASQRKQSGIQPSGEILGYPVYTTDVLPAFSASAISTKFCVFANLKLALAVGMRGGMEVAKSTDATVGGKNLFAANQTAYRVSQRFAITQALPAAAVVGKTAAS
jgi:HK97 family phage major capsid protein